MRAAAAERIPGPEAPGSGSDRIILGLVGLVPGTLALATSFAMFLNAGEFISSSGSWLVAGLAVVSACLGVFFTHDRYSAIAAGETGRQRFGS